MRSTKNKHLTIEERRIIQIGIENASNKKAIAVTLGKDDSTIGKEIKLHRVCKYKCAMTLECSNYKRCKYKRNCTITCPDYKKFKCNRRDRSPGACNGCSTYNSCRFTKYKYMANEADYNYHLSLKDSRIGVNATVNKIRELGLLIKPLLEKGQSIYAILENHKEINLCEKTIYNYIKNGVFFDAGVSINCIDLKRQVSRKAYKVKYSPRKDRSYLKGRTEADYIDYIETSGTNNIVQMDSVYNDVSNGPFLQTFKFLKYDFLFSIYQKSKDSISMLNGILLLEEILGSELFQKEVEVLKTDRGSEFILANQIETRIDGTCRTRIFYCDPMASWQKGSLENVHILLREICPKGVDLKKLGLNSQIKANIISSNINSYTKEKLNGKSSFQLMEFFNPEMIKKFASFGVSAIEPDNIALKPYILK